MSSGKELVLEYCAAIQTHDIDHLQSCIDNERDIKSGKYLQSGWELSGCPSSYGLPEFLGLCFEEEIKGYKEQCEQCRTCWREALDSNFDR